MASVVDNLPTPMEKSADGSSRSSRKRKPSDAEAPPTKRLKGSACEATPLSELFENMGEDEWSRFVHFDDKRYCRNLVSYDKKYSLFVMCWAPGQKTPVHNHGDQETRSWVRVVKGTLTHTRYVKGKRSNAVAVTEAQNLRPESGVVFMNDQVGEHSTGNASDSEPAISVHLFSPPYLLCAFQDEAGNMGHIPPVHCEPLGVGPRFVHSHRLAVQTGYRNNPCFVNFRHLVQLLRLQIKKVPKGEFHTPEHIEHIRDLLSSLEFNPKEWMQYAHFVNNKYTRNLVGYDENFTVLLLCWEKGQMSPIHDHAGSSCWVKVLEGEVTEARYSSEAGPDGRLQLLQQATFMPDAVAYINDTMGTHAMGNLRTDRRAISLHIYSPPYHKCRLYKEEDASTREVTITCANGVAHDFTEEQSLAPVASEPPSLNTLVKSLKAEFQSGKPSSARLGEILDSSLIKFQKKEWEQYIHFGEYTATRNLLALHPSFSLVLICWNVGQGTPVHDHDDRDSWTKVLEGTVRLSRFKEVGGTAVEEVDLSPKDSVRSNAADVLGLHKLQNISESTAITLHLYSPPYTGCCYREPETGESATLPVVYCSSLTAPDMESDGAVLCGAAEEDPLASHAATSSLLRSQLPGRFGQDPSLFADFETYLACLHQAFKKFDGVPCPDEVCRLMSCFQVDKKEWLPYVCSNSIKHSVNLVAYNECFSLHLICWGKGQESSMHNHEKATMWFTILEGELEEVQYYCDNGALEEEQRSTFVPGGVMYRRSHVTHKLRNPKSRPAYSLHLHSPPFEAFTVFDKAKKGPPCNTP